MSPTNQISDERRTPVNQWQSGRIPAIMIDGLDGELEEPTAGRRKHPHAVFPDSGQSSAHGIKTAPRSPGAALTELIVMAMA